MKNVTIIGAGAYSIALSRILDKNSVSVTLYTKFSKEKELLQQERGNNNLLPGIKLSDSTNVSDDLEKSIEGRDLIIISVPSDTVRSVLQDLKPHYKGQNICIASKGIEQSTGYFMDQVIREELELDNVCVLSGPSFAIEIANFQPTMVTVAGNNDLTNMVSSYLSTDEFKIEETVDIRGTLICGAFKNVLAIGAGILTALDAGDSTAATLTVSGTREVGTICEVLGGQKSTVYLSCGLGDNIAACAGTSSRNKQLGILVGKGHSGEEALQIQGKTAEGYTALLGAKKLIEEKNLHVPIIEAICNIILNDADPKSLMTAICK